MAAKENLMDKSFTNTWMAAVTGHSSDCRGRFGHSSEPANTGYLHPVSTALTALVWATDSARSFLAMQKQKNINNIFRTCILHSLPASLKAVSLLKETPPKNHDTDIIHSFIKARTHAAFSSKDGGLYKNHTVGNRSAWPCGTEVAVSL